MPNQKGRIKKGPPAGLNWFKNVAKSLGYSSMDLVREMVPATYDFTSTNTTTVRELVTDIRNLKSSIKKLQTGLGENEYSKIAKQGLKNALDDIKSGKLYNQERLNKLNEEEMGIGDFNFDFEDFNMSDLNEPESTKEVKSETGTTVINNFRPTVFNNDPIVRVLGKQSEIVAKSAETTSKTMVSIASQQMVMDSKMFDMMHGNLDAVNRNLASLVTFQSDSMGKYVGASLKYYEDSLKSMNEQLIEMRKLTAGITQTGQTKPKESPLYDLFGAYGGLDMKAYGKNIVKNFLDSPEGTMMTSVKQLMDKDTLRRFASNPLMFASNKILQSFVPPMIKKTLAQFDKNMSAFFPALLTKITRLSESGNPLLELIGNIFGVNVGGKRSADLSKYNRGQVPFDGETRSAITHVIPTYLRKILAVLSGQPEMGFDYNTLKFKSMGSMREEYERARDRQSLSPFSEARNYVDTLTTNRYRFATRESKEAFNKNLDKFFLKLATSKGENLTNLFKDDSSDLDAMGLDVQFTEYMKKVLRMLPTNVLMNMVGKNVLEAREAQSKFFERIEKNPSEFNYLSLESWGNDINTKAGKKGSGGNPYSPRERKGLYEKTDELGYSQLDYLRHIKETLMGGIVVFPRNDVFDSTNPKLKGVPKHIREMKLQHGHAMADHAKEEKQTMLYSGDEGSYRERLARQGQTLVRDEWDLTGMSSERLAAMVHDEEMGNREGTKAGKLLKWFGKFFRGSAQDKYNEVVGKIEDFLQTPIKLLSDVFTSIDQTMYRIIFGEKRAGTEGQQSFLSKILDNVTIKFKEINDWMRDKFFNPIKEKLIGEDGIITKFEKSEFFKSFVEKTKGFFSKLFGSYDETEGKLKGGIFGDVGNEMRDMWLGFRYYFNGKPYSDSKKSYPDNTQKSVFGEVGTIFKGFGSNLKKYFFGDADATGEKERKGIFGTIGTELNQGFKNFYSLIFGHSKVNDAKQKVLSLTEYGKIIKERAPKSLAWGMIGGGAGLAFGGQLGLLGSLFLPGGPIGGAIVGTFLGFLSQSEKFKSWLLGPVDEATGTRIGGFIGKRAQAFLSKNKIGIIGGATMGVVKAVTGIGLLPGLIVGGPIGGAIMGAGISMALGSEKLKSFLFGKIDSTTGKRDATGIIAKLFGKVKSATGKDNKFGNMLAGGLGGVGLGLLTSQFGLLGGMVLGGPLGGAVLGSAAGFLISSTKWRERLFGKEGDDGLRHGGLFEKLINWTNLQILKPIKLKMDSIKLNVSEWFDKSIKNPFLDAIAPMKQMFKDMMQNMKDMFKAGWDDFKGFIGTTFEKFVGIPFGKFMEEKVMKPLKGFLNRIIGGIGKIFSSILTAPIKMLTAITTGYERDQSVQAEAKFRAGEKFGRKGIVYGIKARLFGRYDEEDKAKLAAKVAEQMPYREERDKEKEARDAATAREYDIKRRWHTRKEQRLTAEQDRARAGDYLDANFRLRPVVPVNRISSPTAQTESVPPPPFTPVPPTSRITGGPTQSEPSFYSARHGGFVPYDTENMGEVGGTIRERFARAGGSPIPPGASPTPFSNTATLATGTGRNFKGSNDVLSKMEHHLSIIAKAVDGQLNGVGYNVNVIKKILKKGFGSGEGDEGEEPENRRYETIFQRVKSFLLKPFTFIGDKIKGMITSVTDRIKAVADSMVNAVKGVVAGIKSIVMGVLDGIKWVGKTLIGAAATILKVPFELAKSVANLTRGALEVLKMVGPGIAAGIQSIGLVITGAAIAVKDTLAGFGAGVFEILYGFGEGVGGILSGIGSLIGGSFKFLAGTIAEAGPAIVRFVGNTVNKTVDFTLDAISMISKKVLDVASTLIEIVTSPFKFVGNLLGKLAGGVKKVEIAGGTLDVVRVVESIGKGSAVRETDLSRLERLSREGANIRGREVDVRIVGSSVSLPVYLSSERLATTPPIKVRVVQEKPTRNGFRVPSGIVVPEALRSAFSSALTTYDAQEDKEDAAKAQQLEEEKTKEAIAARGGASSVLSRKQAEEEKLKMMSEDQKQTSLLEKLVGVNKEQHSDWLSIFGSKGLGTLAIVGGVYALKKFFDDPSFYLTKMKDMLVEWAPKIKDMIVDSLPTLKTLLIEWGPALATALALSVTPKLAMAAVGVIGVSVAKLAKAVLGKVGGMVARGLGLTVAGGAGAAAATGGAVAGGAATGTAVAGGAATGGAVAAIAKRPSVLKAIMKKGGWRLKLAGLIGLGYLGANAMDSISPAPTQAATDFENQSDQDTEMVYNEETGEFDEIPISSATQRGGRTLTGATPTSATEYTGTTGGLLTEIGADLGNVYARKKSLSMFKESLTNKIKSKFPTPAVTAATPPKITTTAAENVANATRRLEAIKSGSIQPDTRPLIKPAESAAKESDDILKSITKFFNKIIGPDSTICKKLDSFFAGNATKSRGVLRTFVTKALEKITVILKSPKMIVHMAKVVKGITLTATKIAAGLASAGIITGAFALWDGTTGAIDAANMFNISEDEVDAKARISAAIIKIIFGLMPVIDVLVEVGQAIIGFNLKQQMAVMLYKALATNVEAVNMDQAISKFEQEAKNAGKTVDEYNAEKNQTTTDWLGKQAKIVTDYWSNVGKDIAKTSGNVWDATKKAGSNFIDGVKNFSPFIQVQPKKPTTKTPFVPNFNPAPFNPKTFVPFGRGGYGVPGGYGADKINNFVYFSQNDPDWKNYNYDRSPSIGGHDANPTLSYRGCGPTAMAMVASQLTGRVYEPPMLADMAKQGGYSVSSGTAWSYFPAMAKRFNLESYDIGGDLSKGIPFLQSGKPLIISGTRPSGSDANSSPFTTGGHFVVATGIDGDKILINDPRSSGQSKPYSLSTVMKQAANAWVFTPTGDATGLPDSSGFTSDLTNKATSGNTNMSPDVFAQVSDASASLFKSAFPMDDLGTMGTALGSLVGSLFGAKETISSDEASEMSGKKGTLVKTNNDFINKIAPGALKAYTKYGVLPSLTLAQAALESGWGKYGIGNNIFGVKVGSNWTGKKQLAWTTEQRPGGAKYKIQDWFRDYDSIDDSILDHGKVLAQRLYDGVRAAKNYKEAAYAVKKAGYATDINYPQKLIDIIESNGLQKFDVAGGFGEPTKGISMDRGGLNFSNSATTNTLKSMSSGNASSKMNEELLQQAVGILSEISGHTNNTSNNMGTLAKNGIRLDITTKGTMGTQIEAGGMGGVNNIVLSNPGTSRNAIYNDLNGSAGENDLKGYRQATDIAKGRIY